jgi:hypothetical protein
MAKKKKEKKKDKKLEVLQLKMVGLKAQLNTS